MFIAAAKAIAESAAPGELVPSPLELSVHHRVSRAVARTALDLGLNSKDLTGYFDE
jgi:malic enzyme